MHAEIETYLIKAQEQLEGKLSGLSTHTAALIELINLVKQQQERIERLEAAIIQRN